MPNNKRRSRSVERAFAVLSAVADGAQPVGVSDLARTTGLPKSSVHLALQTMRDLGFVAQELDGDRYVLGLAAAQLGIRAMDDSTVLGALAPAMQDLADRSQEAVSLGVRTAGEVLFVKRFETSHVLRTSIREGSRMPLHASASGKCLLAGMDDHEVLELYPDAVLPEQAGRTLRDRDALLAELEDIRRRGWATSHDEFLDGVAGVAVPVRLGQRVVGSLSVAGPTGRIVPEDWVDDLLAITTDHFIPTAPGRPSPATPSDADEPAQDDGRQQPQTQERVPT